MKYSKIMIRDKRAVSGVVTTLIIIAIALAALGIAWGFIRNIVNEAGEGVEGQQSGLIESITSTCAEGGYNCTATECAEDDTTHTNLDDTCDTDYVCCESPEVETCDDLEGTICESTDTCMDGEDDIGFEDVDDEEYCCLGICTPVAE